MLYIYPQIGPQSKSFPYLLYPDTVYFLVESFPLEKEKNKPSLMDYLNGNVLYGSF